MGDYEVFTFIRLRIGITFQLLTLLILPSIASTFSAPEWVAVPGGKTRGISGMALLNKDGPIKFLVVHDRDTVPRLGIVTPDSSHLNYTPLQGKNLPSNLEAISSIPDKNGQFLALSSDGQVFLLTVSSENGVTSERRFLLPRLPPYPDFEGLSVQNLGGQPVIVWGHRGAGRQSGILYLGLLDPNMNKPPVLISTHEIWVKYPRPDDDNTRHISDLKVDKNGVVWASATYDGSDDGPFESAVYILGVVRVLNNSAAKFEEHTDRIRLWAFVGKKVEAIELVPGPDGGVALGAENENEGGWLYYK